MAEIAICNPKFLSRLDEISDELLSKIKDCDVERYHTYRKPEDMKRGEEFCSIGYLEECMKRDKLVGAPDRYYGCPIAKMSSVDPHIWDDYKQRVKYDFAQELGAHTSALLTYYPPGGYVGWHTNYDANAYQILFTWSDGLGYFRYWDNDLKQIVHIQDVAGWQCRHYYFGSEKEPENLCWHSAFSRGERITLAYKFVNNGIANGDTKDQQAQLMRDMLIEEIENS